MSDDYASQRVGHALLLGPTAPMVTQLLRAMEQFITTSQTCGFIIQSVVQLAVAKNIFVWIVGQRCSVNYFSCAIQIILFTYLQASVHSNSTTITGK